MKKISLLLAMVACAFAQLAFANSAIVTSITGTVTAQTGNAAPRTLRQGDEVQQGVTVSTGAASAAVLRFADGQVAALSANSQMQVTTYRYEQQTGTGAVLLSLVKGGMRAITGLIGKAAPQQISYRAATATIGIRGTDVTIVTNGTEVTVTVTEGAVSFAYAGKTLIIPAGKGVNAKKDGTFQEGAAQQIINSIPADLADALKGLEGVKDLVQQAAKGNPGKPDDTPGRGPPGADEGTPRGPPLTNQGNGNGTPGGGGGGGGGPSKV